MLRKFVCAAFAVLICVGVLLADEIKGKVTKVDAEKGVVTVKVGEKDRNFKVGKDTKILGADGKDLADGLKAKDVKEGAEVTVEYEKKDKKTIVKCIKFGK